jgi:hypothetical protein
VLIDLRVRGLWRSVVELVTGIIILLSKKALVELAIVLALKYW